MSNIAEQVLLKKRAELIAERDKFIAQYLKEIQAIDLAIRAITGKSPTEVSALELYDDQNPDYIRNTEDGI